VVDNHVTPSILSYILVKVQPLDDIPISLPGLPPNTLPIEAEKFTYTKKDGRTVTRTVTMTQYPVTSAYSITDYKSQGGTFPFVIADIAKPYTGFSANTSAYVQLSRATSLNRVSILRAFTREELTEPLPSDLVAELEWHREMAKKTKIDCL